MGWKCINGREYYYQSRRRVGRVETIYVGPGAAGCRAARMQLVDRQKRADEKRRWQAERAESDAIEQAVSEWFDDVQRVADAAMIAAGFHKHKGQWRRKSP